MNDSTLSNDVAAIFDAVLELPAAERRAFLDRRCANNRQLREEVESLLQADGEVDSFLRSPLHEASRVGAMLKDVDLVGRQIGPYLIQRRIAEGGGGVVYFGERTEPFTQRVAIKVIKLRHGTTRSMTLFRSECQLLASLEHPNIARVYDGGQEPSGHPYLVMEYIDGDRITRYCRAQHLGIRDRLELFLQVCAAVEHAHVKGIIHRDLKPSNVLIAVHDGRAIPKVIDFGTARVLNDASISITGERLSPNEVIGTPAYMSPEQAGVEAVGVDTRTDVYGLGALLYELLTDRPPFAPDALAQMNLRQLRAFLTERSPDLPSDCVRSRDPVEPSDQTAISRQAQARALQGELERIPLKAMNRNREDRYQSVAELAADIRNYLTDRPVEAYGQSRGYRTRKWIRRHRLPLAVAAVGLATFGVAGAAMVNTTIARQQEIAAQETATDLLNFLFETFSFSLPEGGLPVRSDLAGLIEMWDARLKHGPFTRQEGLDASVRAWVGLLQATMGQTDKAKPHLERALAFLRGDTNLLPKDRALYLGVVGKGYLSMNQPAQAASILQESKAILDASGNTKTRAYAKVLAAFSSAQLVNPDGNHLAEAEELAKQWVSVAREMNDDLDLGDALNYMGGKVLGKQPTRLAEALDYAKQALALREKNDPPVPTRVTLSYYWVSMLSRRNDKMDDSVRFGQLAIDSPGMTEFGDHPWAAEMIREISNVFWEADMLPQAEQAARRAVAMDRTFSFERQTGLADSLNRLGCVLRDQAKWEEAEAVYREELSTRRARKDSASAITGTQLGLAQTLLAAGVKKDEALTLAQAAAEKRQADGVNPGSWAGRNANLIHGWALAENGRKQEATEKLHAAVAGIMDQRGISTERKVRALQVVIDAFTRLGNVDTVRQYQDVMQAIQQRR